MKRIRAVLMLYQGRSLLVALAGGLFIVLVLGKAFVARGQWFLLDELTTVWLCIWMPLAFQFGVMIKHQMASPMARLVPGYRAAHIFVGSFLWVGVAVVTAWWLAGLMDFIGERIRIVWIVLCLGTFLTTIVIAYISERMVLFIGYGILLIIVGETWDILHFLIISDAALWGLMGVAGLLFAGFLWRLAILNEGMVEYAYVLSWPLHRARGHAPSRPYVYQKAPRYAEKKGLILQAFHWAYVEDEDVAGVGKMLFAGAGVFVAYVLFFAGPRGFYAHPYANFLVFVAVPLVVMLCFYYRIVAFRDYALLRPVRRESLALQWGVLLALALLASWMLTSVLFGVIPAMLWGLPFLHELKFWVYVLFTGAFAQMTLAWLMYVSTCKDQRRAVGLVVLYGVYALVEFWSVPAYEVRTILMHIGFVAVAGIVFATTSYYRWCREEV